MMNLYLWLLCEILHISSLNAFLISFTLNKIEESLKKKKKLAQGNCFQSDEGKTETMSIYERL